MKDFSNDPRQHTDDLFDSAVGFIISFVAFVVIFFLASIIQIIGK